MERYRKRIVEPQLSRKLESMGAVLVEVPKWCGKPTTCKQFAKSILDLSDPDVRFRVVELAEIDIKSLLVGDTPRLIDEWQIVPRFWDAIRHLVDGANGTGHFLLTGSAVVPENKWKQIQHSGTGRISRLRMRPMSLYVEAIAESDLSRMDGIPRSPERIRRLLRSLARLQATQTSLASIRKGIVANDD